MAALLLFDAVAARLLGIEEYAEWTFFFAVLTTLFYIGWLGINVSAKVRVSKCVDPEQKNCCITAAMLIRVAASLMFCTCLFVLAPRLASLIGYPQKYPHLKEMLYFACGIVFFNSINEAYKELFIGLQKYRELFLVTSWEHVGYLLFLVLLWQAKRDVYAPVFAYLAGEMLTIVIGAGLLKKKQGFRFTSSPDWAEKYIKPICRYAVPLALIGIGSVILIEMDTLLLGILNSKQEVAIYSIGKTLTSKGMHVNMAIVSGTLPAIIGRGAPKDETVQIRKVEKANLLISLAIFAGLMLCADLYVYIVYGRAYMQAALPLRILSVYCLMNGLTIFYANYLDFKNKAKIRSVFYTTTILLNFVMDVLLIPQWGAVGAALATDISLLPYLVAVWFCYRRTMKKEVLI